MVDLMIDHKKAITRYNEVLEKVVSSKEVIQPDLNDDHFFKIPASLYKYEECCEGIMSILIHEDEKVAVMLCKTEMSVSVPDKINARGKKMFVLSGTIIDHFTNTEYEHGDVLEFPMNCTTNIEFKNCEFCLTLIKKY